MSDTAYKAALMASWIEALEAEWEENGDVHVDVVRSLLRDLKAGLKRLASGEEDDATSNE